MPRRGVFGVAEEWKEVILGNNYALFIGYMSMAIKGLGFLVLTWTTVVLLGGFVSTLQKKDFWCLTFITLVQTAGIFDAVLTEKLIYIKDSLWGLMTVTYAAARLNPLQHKYTWLASTIAVIHAVVFYIPLCPLVAVYIYGLYISAGISAWRLRQHDYGSDADGLGNLKPALDLLYSLALLQGVIFFCMFIYSLASGFVVDIVLKERKLGDQYRDGISEYLWETIIECRKDPSFARGRNLITYAVDLMGSKSPDDYQFGVEILDGITKPMEKAGRIREEEPDLMRIDGFRMEDRKQILMHQHMLVKHLIMYASSSDILQKLLQTLNYRSIYDRETRDRAARIVATIAEDICLEEFPTGIHFISSLINTFREYCLVQPYHRDWTFEQDWYGVANSLASTDSDKQENNSVELPDAYMELILQGYRILWKLAINIGNCRIMLDTPYLLRKIMAPVTSDLLHHIDHGAWSSIVEGSLKVVHQLAGARGQTGTKLRSEIASNKEAISTMERILECDKCDEKLQKLVIWILTSLYTDTCSILQTTSREIFIKKLVDIVTGDNKHKDDTLLEAANSLVVLSLKTERGAMIILKANDNVVDNLTTMIVEKCGRQVMAANILEHLCCYYTDDDESLKNLKKAMTNAVPKVFGEIVWWASEETHRGTEVDHVSLMTPETDVENQCADTDDNGQENNSSSNHQQGDKMNEYGVVPMLSFCVTVCDTFISADQDLARQFDATAPRDGELNFPRKLKEIVKKSMHLRPDCVEIVKLTCKMVISMMKHRGTYVKEDLESLMDALSSASTEMFLLDGSLVFDIKDDDTMTLKPFRSLASLVKEAQELVDKHYALSN